MVLCGGACRGGIVDIARRYLAEIEGTMIYDDYTTAPDGTYLPTMTGLAPVNVSNGYWVGLKTNTRAGRNAKFLGIWTAKDGEKFVDPTRWVAELPEALKLAEFHEQIAIWDCQNGEEVYV